jgi:CNT family concentrative nucleoside transporter
MTPLANAAAATTTAGTAAQRLQCLLGLFVFVLLAFASAGGGSGAAGRRRRRSPWRVVLWGLALQFAFAAVVLWTPRVLQTVNDVVDALLGFTRAGATLVFGNLASGQGAPVIAP